MVVKTRKFNENKLLNIVRLKTPLQREAMSKEAFWLNVLLLLLMLVIARNALVDAVRLLADTGPCGKVPRSLSARKIQKGAMKPDARIGEAEIAKSSMKNSGASY